MRAFFFAIPMTIAAVLAGCPSDPGFDLGPPPADCATRGPASVTIRAGQGEPDAGILVAQGFQGGYHIWIDVEPENMGPLVRVVPAVHDVETGELYSDPDLETIAALEPDPSNPDGPSVVVQGRLVGMPDRVIGREVKLSAQVADACPHAASGELTGVVEGYDESF